MKVFFIQCTLLVTEVKKLMKNLSENCPFEKKRSLNRRLAFGYTGQREKQEARRATYRAPEYNVPPF